MSKRSSYIFELNLFCYSIILAISKVGIITSISNFETKASSLGLEGFTFTELTNISYKCANFV